MKITHSKVKDGLGNVTDISYGERPKPPVEESGFHFEPEVDTIIPEGIGLNVVSMDTNAMWEGMKKMVGVGVGVNTDKFERMKKQLDERRAMRQKNARQFVSTDEFRKGGDGVGVSEGVDNDNDNAMDSS